MKKALTLLLIFVLSTVIGTAILATLFMFNMDMMTYITDTDSSLFSLNFFLYGACLALPLVCVGTMLAIVLVMIRNSKNQLPCFITYVLLGALTWLLLIPFSLKQTEKFEGIVENVVMNSTSPGIFREDSSGVFYYSRILENGNTDGIFIDTTGYLDKKDGFVTFYDVPVNNASAYPYSDILIKRAVQPSRFVVLPLSIYSTVLTSATHYNSLGFLSWLCFASMGLAFLSVYGVQFFSEWKLSSGLFAISIVVGVLLLNFFFYMGLIPDFIKDFSTALSENLKADNALMVIVNSIISVILILCGIVMKLYRLRKGEVNVVEAAEGVE